MPFDFASAKTRSRQVVHSTLAVAAVYTDADHTTPVPVTVRWHSKLARAGALEGGFGVEVIEGIDRLVFNRDELAVAVKADADDPGTPLELASLGVVYIESYDARFSLEAREPYDGPVSEYWTVALLGSQS